MSLWLIYIVLVILLIVVMASANEIMGLLKEIRDKLQRIQEMHEPAPQEPVTEEIDDRPDNRQIR